MYKKLNYDVKREDWQDYKNQKCVMYCPPLQYHPKTESIYMKYTYFAATSLRFLCSPQTVRNNQKCIDGLNMRGYALDNGAYICYTKKQPFNHDAFDQYLDQYAAFADWVVLPDVVCDKKKTLALADQYIEKIQAKHQGIKMLIVWQDGMIKDDILRFVCNGIGVFIGGSTKGKLKNMKWIADLCKVFSVWCHVGRVNSIKRMNLVVQSGACSFDGSGIVRFPVTLDLLTKKLLNNQKQMSLFDNFKLSDVFLASWLKKKRLL